VIGRRARDAGTRASFPIAGAVLGLVVMVTWTLVIKFLAPLLYLVSQRAAGSAPTGAPVMWDFWWVAHLALAWRLWRRHPRAWTFGVVVSALEIVIVTVKLVAYLLAPDLSFWRLLWFTNKVYVLAFFLVLLVLLMRRREWLDPTARRNAATSAGAPS